MFRIGKIQTISKLIASGIINYVAQYTQSVVNYVQVASDTAMNTNDKITINLRDKESTPICTNFPLMVFQSLSDILFGYTTNCPTIDIGSVDARNLEINVETQLGLSAPDAARNVEVQALTIDEDAPQMIKTYEYSTDLNRGIIGAQRIYVYGAGLHLAANKQDITIVGDGYNNTLNTFQAVKCSEAMSRVEAQLQLLACVYEAEDNIPIDLSFSVGAGATITGIVIERHKYIEEVVSQGEIDKVDRKALKIEKFEQKNSSAAKAMRRSGILVKSQELRKIRRSMNVSGK